MEDTMEETVFELQQEVIRQLAEKESAVFVGRCADEALRKAGHKVLSVFISAPPQAADRQDLPPAGPEPGGVRSSDRAQGQLPQGLL